MDPKLCTSCHAPHFEDYDLCRWCADERQRELEHRLRQDDGKPSWMVLAAEAVHGKQPRFKRVWRIG